MKTLARTASAVSAAVVSLSLLTLSPVCAATATFVTPTGSSTGGGPVSASASFTTSDTNGGTISVTLQNLQANITDVAQALSDLFITYSGSNLTGGTVSGTGQAITVNSNGTTTLGSTINAGWVFTNQGSNSLLLDVLAGPGHAGPANTIIGPPGPGGVYTNANGSIAGNGPHNPFLNQTASFTISLAGITANTLITDATFSFGTTAGVNVPGVPGTSPVPIPGALLLFGSGLAGLGLLGAHKRKKPAALAA